jgi:hypothetical protein
MPELWRKIYANIFLWHHQFGERDFHFLKYCWWQIRGGNRKFWRALSRVSFKIDEK